MRKLFDGISKAVGKISEVFLIISAAVLFLVVALIFVDVIMRYIVNRPISGQQELAELGTVVVVYFGLPYATRIRSHVRVEPLTGKLNPSARSILYGVLDLLICAFMVLMTVKIFQQAGNLAKTPGNATLILRIPYFYIYYITSAGACLSAAEFLLDGVRYLLEGAGAGRGDRLKEGGGAK